MTSTTLKVMAVSVVAIVLIGGAAYYTWQPRRFNSSAPVWPEQTDPLATVVDGRTYRQWLSEYANDRVDVRIVIDRFLKAQFPIPLLVSSFNDTDADVRLGGVMLFVRWRTVETAHGDFDRQDVHRWQDRIGDPDARVSGFMVEHTWSVGVLADWLGHSNPDVRKKIIRRLKLLSVPYEDGKTLTSQLKSDDVEVRRGAVEVIESWILSRPDDVNRSIRGQWEQSVFDSDKRIRLRVINHVERPELLIRCLNHHDKVIAIAASNRLKTVEFRKSRIPGLLQLCRDEKVCPGRFDDLGPMPAAIMAVFKKIGADSIEPLLAVMVDPKESAEMRTMAHHTLCHLSGHASELAKQVTPLLKHEDPEVRLRASDLMGRVRGGD